MIDQMTTPTSGVEALRRAYDEHAPGLLRMAVALGGDRAGAEDLVHDAFLRLHRQDRWPDDDKLGPYLRRTVANLAYDRHRRATVGRRLRPVSGGDAPSAEAEAEGGDRSRRVAAAIAALPDRQRDCVALHYFGGLTDAAVAAELGLAVGSVKTHLHRARAALALTLEDLR